MRAVMRLLLCLLPLIVCEVYEPLPEELKDYVELVLKTCNLVAECTPVGTRGYRAADSMLRIGMKSWRAEEERLNEIKERWIGLELYGMPPYDEKKAMELLRYCEELGKFIVNNDFYEKTVESIVDLASQQLFRVSGQGERRKAIEVAIEEICKRG